MMTKPPGFASSSTLPMDEEDEESIDESLDEILLEANEKPQDNSAKSLEAVPSSLDETDDDDPDVLDSSPLSAGGNTARTAAAQSEITVIAPRPTFADDDEVVKEETKVDPYETAIRAAATRDEPLTSQASHQRERALRKSTTQSRLPARAALATDDDFEDAETGDGGFDSSRHGVVAGERTPADIPIHAEDSGSSPAGGYASASSGVAGFMPRLPPPGRPMPPPGRPDIYPGRRIPTPSSDFLSAQSGGFGSGAHYPSIAIPAPSAHDTSARANKAAADNRVRLPPAGLAAFLVVAFGGGVLVGAMLWRGHASGGAVDLPVVTHVVSKPSVEPMQPIVVKPVPPPSPSVAAVPGTSAAAPGAAPSAPGAAPATAPAAAPAAVPTLAAETPAVADTPPPPPVVEKPKKAKPKKTTTLDEDLAAAESDSLPPPPKPRRKKAVVWQDPFAQ